MQRLARTVSLSRMDWKVCYEAGGEKPDYKYRLKFATLVKSIGLVTDGRANLALYLPPRNLWAVLLRLLFLPYHIWLVKKLEVIPYVSQNFPGISRENQICCEKFFILGAINSTLD